MRRNGDELWPAGFLKLPCVGAQASCLLKKYNSLLLRRNEDCSFVREPLYRTRLALPPRKPWLFRRLSLVSPGVSCRAMPLARILDDVEKISQWHRWFGAFSRVFGKVHNPSWLVNDAAIRRKQRSICPPAGRFPHVNLAWASRGANRQQFELNSASRWRGSDFGSHPTSSFFSSLKSV